MANVINAEIYKLRKSILFRGLCMFLTFMLVYDIASTFKVYLSQTMPAEEKARYLLSGIDSYFLTFDGDIFFMFLLILSIGFITSEFSQYTIRQMACRGISRGKIIVGQYLTMSVASTLVYILFGTVLFIFNSLLNGIGNVDVGKFIVMNIGIASITWGMIGLGSLLSYVFKNPALTLGIGLVLIIGNQLMVGKISDIINKPELMKYCFRPMKGVIINMESDIKDMLICTSVFLVLGIVCALISTVLFVKRDVD